jgi:hypothetical protein
MTILSPLRKPELNLTFITVSINRIAKKVSEKL